MAGNMDGSGNRRIGASDMRKFHECTLWGDMSADRASEQYPTEKVCKSCIRKFGKADQEVIASVGPEVGAGDASECFFAESH